MKMTINSELPVPIENKLHRIHHQHHFHHHHVHHLLHQHIHYLHLNSANPIVHDMTTHTHNHGHDHYHNDHQDIIAKLHDSQKQLQLRPTKQLIKVPNNKHQQVQPHQQQQQLAVPRRQSVKSTQKSQIKFFLLAAFAYALSPIDLIPEVIFGVFGILDDLLFLLMCLFCIAITIIYPIFREMQGALLQKIGLKGKEKFFTNHKCNKRL